MKRILTTITTIFTSFALLHAQEVSKGFQQHVDFRSEVRAIWDETDSKWWFSVLDIVGVLNAQDDYTKNRNYWKYLKNKLKNEGSEVVSVTNQLKLLHLTERDDLLMSLTILK